MRIGQLAAKASVNIQTIRFYERRGILEEPPRSSAGYRCYSQTDLEALCFIRRSQGLGFSLQEIAQLLPLHRSIAQLASPKDCRPREIQEMTDVARSRLEQVEQKLRSLKTMRAQLLSFIAQLETSMPTKCLAPPSLPAAEKTVCRRA